MFGTFKGGFKRISALHRHYLSCAGCWANEQQGEGCAPYIQGTLAVATDHVHDQSKQSSWYYGIVLYTNWYLYIYRYVYIIYIYTHIMCRLHAYHTHTAYIYIFIRILYIYICITYAHITCI